MGGPVEESRDGVVCRGATPDPYWHMVIGWFLVGWAGLPGWWGGAGGRDGWMVGDPCAGEALADAADDPVGGCW